MSRVVHATKWKPVEPCPSPATVRFCALTIRNVSGDPPVVSRAVQAPADGMPLALAGHMNRPNSKQPTSAHPGDSRPVKEDEHKQGTIVAGDGAHADEGNTRKEDAEQCEVDGRGRDAGDDSVHPTSAPVVAGDER
jgi:hypothetical protein